MFNKGFEKIAISKNFIDKAHENFLSKKFIPAYENASPELKEKLDKSIARHGSKIESRLNRAEDMNEMKFADPAKHKRWRRLEKSQQRAAVDSIRKMYEPAFPKKTWVPPKKVRVKKTPPRSSIKGMLASAAIGGGGGYLVSKYLKKEKNPDLY